MKLSETMVAARTLRTEIGRHRWRHCDCPRIANASGRKVRACAVEGSLHNRRYIAACKRGVRLAMGQIAAKEGLLIDGGICMQPRGGKLDQMIEAIRDGKTCREIRDLVGCHHDTVAKLKKHMQRRGLAGPCLCGRESGHKGWCREKFLLSPRRQAALAALHKKQKSGGQS